MRLIDADELIERLLESRREETETTLKLIRFFRKQPTIEPSLVGTQMSLPQYLDDGDIVKHENDMVTMNYNTYQDLLEPKRGRWIAGAEVIRCKDCVHSDTFPKGADNDMPLKCLGIRYGGVMPDWYCEHAERREEGL